MKKFRLKTICQLCKYQKTIFQETDFTESERYVLLTEHICNGCQTKKELHERNFNY